MVFFWIWIQFCKQMKVYYKWRTHKIASILYLHNRLLSVWSRKTRQNWTYLKDAYRLALFPWYWQQTSFNQWAISCHCHPSTSLLHCTVAQQLLPRKSQEPSQNKSFLNAGAQRKKILIKWKKARRHTHTQKEWILICREERELGCIQLSQDEKKTDTYGWIERWIDRQTDRRIDG